MAYKGIQKIKIPVKTEDISSKSGFISVLQQYLNICLNAHNENAIKENTLFDYYMGKQDILQKTRPFTNNGNNKIVENHAKRQVDFKVDFLLGDKMQFSHKSEQCNDDLHILDRFLSDSGFYTEQREFKKDAYIYGVGVTFCQPRTDIIDNGGYIPEYDKDTESPFEIHCVEPQKNFVIYSSYIGEKPLFGVNVAYVGADLGGISNKGKYIVTVYSELFTAEFNAVSNIKANFDNNTITENAFKNIPIIEHCYNKERMGIIETNKSLFDAINFIVSNSADAIYDSVNRVFIFKNIDVDDDVVPQMLESGIVVIKSNNPETPADCYTIDLKFSQDDANKFYEERVSKAYDIAGVPLASGVTTSGGDTGKARLLGGGWENAYTILKGEIIGCEKSDYALLKQMLEICRTVPGTKVNELVASQIEIHYNLNPNDNILSKTQAAQNLYAINYPLEGILKATNISLDACADAAKWQENIDQKQATEIDNMTASFENETASDKQKTDNKDIATEEVE